MRPHQIISTPFRPNTPNLDQFNIKPNLVTQLELHLGKGATQDLKIHISHNSLVDQLQTSTSFTRYPRFPVEFDPNIDGFYIWPQKLSTMGITHH